MVRRDANGLTHWANPPTPKAYYQGVVETSAFCNPGQAVRGDLVDVDQSGPTCLWCLVVFKRTP